MDLLKHLQSIPGPAGDEGEIADEVERLCESIGGAQLHRHGDLLLAVRGRPRVAVFAHLDTTGFTLGYDRTLIPIGGPHVEGDERLREVGGAGKGRIKVRAIDNGTRWTLSGKAGEPGSRWVFAEPLMERKNELRGPYLDNRAGVWNAVRVLESCEDVAVVFTPGEEHSGRGALIGARLVYQELGITQALISDITWHTASVKIGKGPAISFRDRSLPRRRFLDRILEAAGASGIPFQREVESAGGSDGSSIERSTFPVDWVFIGAPEKRPHTPREVCRTDDLQAMVELYTYLIPALSR
ncbi:MAG: M20/M25/M40 family metallo-hydrolase [Armatimonadota bacterium]